MEVILMFSVVYLLFSVCFFFGYMLAKWVWRVIQKDTGRARMPLWIPPPRPRSDYETTCPDEIADGLTIGILDLNEEEQEEETL